MTIGTLLPSTQKLLQRDKLVLIEPFCKEICLLLFRFNFLQFKWMLVKMNLGGVKVKVVLHKMALHGNVFCAW